MFPLLAHYFQPFDHAFRLFHYLTFRCVVAALTALLISLIFSPRFIRYLQTLQIGQVVRDDGPQSHLKKSGTPTMGGVLILFSLVVSMLLWGDWGNRFLWYVMWVTLGFGLIGGIDDYRKLRYKNSKGLSARGKLICQFGIAGLASLLLFLTVKTPEETQLFIPFFKTVTPSLGIFFIIWSSLVVVGASNAVNLTDGLDGLAIMPVVLVSAAFVVLAYVAGNAVFSKYLSVAYIPGAGEVAVFASALVGAGLGFLWFNAYPAQVFMGDVGSLSIGAALGIMSVAVRQEILLAVMGGIFIAETVSVILQVASFKLTGKRIFRMAPLHHHFELKGWPEPKVIVRFWIVTIFLVLLALATLKVR